MKTYKKLGYRMRRGREGTKEWFVISGTGTTVYCSVGNKGTVFSQFLIEKCQFKNGQWEVNNEQ